MEMKHEQMKENLRGGIGKAFVKDLTRNVFDWAEHVPDVYYNYRVFEELTVRYATGELTRKGLDKNKHYRQDAVLFVEPGRAALNQRSCYSIGIELKGNLKDLRADKKIESYLGWNDFFFIGCTEDILEEAIKRAENDKRIGVFGIETGIICKLPMRSKVAPENRIWMYEQVIFNTIFKDIKTVSFKAEDIDIVPPELVEVTPKILPEYANPSNADGISKEANNPSNNEGINNATLSEEEKAARKAAAKAREDFRKERARQVAAKAQEMPEDVRLKLSSLPDTIQAAYHVLTQNPGIKAWELSEKMGIGEATGERFVARLIENGLIEHQGSKKTGGYHPTKSNQELKYMPKCQTCIIFKKKASELL